MSIRPEFQKALEILGNLVGAPPTIIEVGACIGDGIKLYSDYCGCATIYAIEPDTENYFALVRHKLGALDTVDVNCYKMAISDIDDSSVMLSSDGKRSSMYGNDKRMVYHSMTLDTFIRRENALKNGRIDFIRFDCYGGEYKIFDAPINWMGSTDMVFITMHNKKEGPFSKFKEKREEIIQKFKERHFKMIAGMPNKGHKHIHQLWRKT